MGLKVLLLTLSLCTMLTASDLSICSEKYAIQEQELEQKAHALRKLLQAHPNQISCMLKLASLYLRSGKISEGFDLIRRAYRLDPEYVQQRSISKILDLALRVSRLKELAQKEHDPDLWRELGDTYFDIGSFEEAAKAYEASLKLSPGRTRVAVLLAVSYADSGRRKRAIALLRRIVGRAPYDFYANYYLGKLLAAADRSKEGEKYLMMAAYLLKYGHPNLEKEGEREFFTKDLAPQLERL